MSKDYHNHIKKHRLECKNTNPLLVDYIAGDLLPADSQRFEAHLAECRVCSEEYALFRQLNEEIGHRDEACRAVMASIDWEDTADTITSNIPFKRTPGLKSRKARLDFYLNSLTFSWKLALPMMAGVLLLGIWLGFLFFHTTPTGFPGPADASVPIAAYRALSPGASLDRLENTLARKEVVNYFDQSQLVLTDLMKQCNTEGAFSLQNQVDLTRVKALLSKNRYFRDQLNDPHLMVSQELLKKIEWLLYEILMTSTSEDSSCQKLQQLQDYIKQERLLFKIRLVGKELSVSEV